MLFLFLHKNISYGASNECPQHVIFLRTRDNYPRIIIKYFSFKNSTKYLLQKRKNKYKTKKYLYIIQTVSYKTDLKESLNLKLRLGILKFNSRQTDDIFLNFFRK